MVLAFYFFSHLITKHFPFSLHFHPNAAAKQTHKRNNGTKQAVGLQHQEVSSCPVSRCCLVSNMCAASKVNYIYPVWPLGAASNTACFLFQWANMFTAMVFPGCQGNGPWKLIHQLLQALPPLPPPSPSPLSLLLCAPRFKWYHFGVHGSFSALSQAETAGELLTQ